VRSLRAAPFQGLRQCSMGSRCRLLVDLWKYTQVKLHGSYSAERVLELATYGQERNWVCAVGIMIATPIPCLVVTLVIDTIPLADPAEGVEANKLLFVREYYAFAVMTSLALHQFRKGVPILPYSTCKLVRDTLLVSAGSVGCVYGLTSATGFPLPFTNLMPMPTWGTLVFAAMATQWAKKLRQVPGAAEMLIGTLRLWLCEFLLVFLYPPYFYVFTTISTVKAKMAFALLLPVLKLLMRNLFSRSVGHLGDETPGLVVFHADVFGSLFVAYCMQNSPLLWMTLAVMAVDILVMGMSLRDIDIARKELEVLERRLHTWTNQQGETTILHEGGRKLTTLERASRILQQERGPETAHVAPFYEHSPGPPKHNMAREGPYEGDLGRRNSLPSSFDLPHSRSHAKPLTGTGRVHPARKLGAVPSRLLCVSLKRSYTVKMRRLLYMAEFVLLLNYVEVIIPLVFCKFSCLPCLNERSLTTSLNALVQSPQRSTWWPHTTCPTENTTPSSGEWTRTSCFRR